jgi:hypothetical protein
MSFGQNLTSYNGDYKLNFSVSACNANARVEVHGPSVKITNQDFRDNRGWSTQTLTAGSKSWSLAAGITQTAKVSFVGSQIVVETTTIRGGYESAYVKDTYDFSEKNGRKSLMISLSVATRGNVAGWGTTCGYEKQ